MGLKNLFRKKESVTSLDAITKEIQKADTWLIAHAPVYNLDFDVTVPTRPAREKYITVGEQKKRYETYKKKSVGFIEENFYCSGDKYNLYDLYQWIDMCLTTAFQMVLHAPSESIISFVNFNEASHYFDNVFLKTEELCKNIVYNMKQIEFELLNVTFLDGYQRQINSEFVQYENGIKMIKDCKELEQCEQLLHMLLSCKRYTEYLFSITQYIYKNIPYVLCGGGGYKVIKNWESFNNKLQCHINIGNREHGITTEEDFLKLIE